MQKLAANDGSWISYGDGTGGVEWARAEFRGVAFSPHRHDTYAIGITMAGVQTFRYRGADRHSMTGDAFVLHPDELHDGRQGTDIGYGYRIAYIAPDLIADALPGAPLPFVGDALVSNEKLKYAIEELFPDPAESDDILFLSGTIAALADAMQAVSERPKRPHAVVDRRRMQKVRDHILAHIPAGLSVAALESEHGIDRYTLFRQFRAAYGVSPHRFITMRRLDQARAHIREGKPLCEAALLSGFADQSHMTRRFRAAFGLSPGVWRRLKANPA